MRNLKKLLTLVSLAAFVLISSGYTTTAVKLRLQKQVADLEEAVKDRDAQIEKLTKELESVKKELLKERRDSAVVPASQKEEELKKELIKTKNELTAAREEVLRLQKALVEGPPQKQGRQ